MSSSWCFIIPVNRKSRTPKPQKKTTQRIDSAVRPELNTNERRSQTLKQRRTLKQASHVSIHSRAWTETGSNVVEGVAWMSSPIVYFWYSNYFGF